MCIHFCTEFVALVVANRYMTSRSKTQHKEKEKPPVEVPVIEEKEIIPGKFYEQDWYLLYV